MNADVHALTGAYVLDAVSDAERVEFERHLTECGTCAQEVAELRATTTRLATAAATPPPARLRAAVLDRITEVRQESPQVDELTMARERRAGRLAVRLTSLAAAVLLVVAVTLGVLLVNAERTGDQAEQRAAAMTTLLRADDAEIVSTRTDAGAMSVVYSRARNRVLVLADGMAPAPSGHDYQAWTIGDRVDSAGLLNLEDGSATLESDLHDAQSIGLTVEPAGGSDQPTTDPIMQLPLTD